MMKVVDKILDWENAGKTKLLSVGYSLRAPELLFRKIEDAEVEEQIQKLIVKSKEQIKENKMEEKNSPVTDPKENKQSEGINLKSEITYDDFGKLDLRIGTIISAEKIEKADKLL